MATTAIRWVETNTVTVNTIKDLFALAETSDENSRLWVRSGVHGLQTQLITIFGKRFVYLTDEELTAWCQTPT
jgi:hypothetical protein